MGGRSGLRAAHRSVRLPRRTSPEGWRSSIPCLISAMSPATLLPIPSTTAIRRSTSPRPTIPTHRRVATSFVVAPCTPSRSGLTASRSPCSSPPISSCSVSHWPPLAVEWPKPPAPVLNDGAVAALALAALATIVCLLCGGRLLPGSRSPFLRRACDLASSPPPPIPIAFSTSLRSIDAFRSIDRPRQSTS